MKVSIAFRLLRYTLLGAAAAIMVSGTLGLDAHVHDGIAAVVGGVAAVMIAKFSVVA